MTVWSRLTHVFHDVGVSIAHAFERLRGASTPPERSLAFTIGMIALGAKMAKADGVVTDDEIRAFNDVFQVPDKDHAAVERVFNLAKQDVAGFESYAQQVAELFEARSETLENVLDGLFHIAKADGAVHEDELTYLGRIAELFGFTDKDFLRIRARHVHIADNPYDILGVSPDAPIAEIRAHHRRLVRELHPDKQIAAGLPAEMVRVATDKLARINEAFDRIEAQSKSTAISGTK
jgi:DnaJ like chaperone protein